jgi:predicted DNA-binding transcriptional regulator
MVFDNACFLRKLLVRKEVVDSGYVAHIQSDVRGQVILHRSPLNERRER